MNWIKYNTIEKIPTGLWDKIGKHNPCLSYEFMSIVEKLHPNDLFCYAILHKHNKVIGIAFYYVFNILPSIFNRLSLGKILMTGTFETYGRHFWYDDVLIKEDEFFESFWQLIRAENVLAFIIRDFVTNEFVINPFFAKEDFVHISPYSISWITIPDGCSKLDEYLYLTLTKKHRNTYKRILKERQNQNISFEIDYEFDKHLKRLYALYLNVNKNAREFKSAPIPLIFFSQLKSHFGNNCFCILMRDENQIIGFVLVIQNENIIIPFLMGIDYEYREFHVWHNLTIESIRYAIDNNKKEIDLGLTNFELKKRLGAAKIEINMLARFKNTFINRHFKSALSKLI